MAGSMYDKPESDFSGSAVDGRETDFDEVALRWSDIFKSLSLIKSREVGGVKNLKSENSKDYSDGKEGRKEGKSSESIFMHSHPRIRCQ